MEGGEIMVKLDIELQISNSGIHMELFAKERQSKGNQTTDFDTTKDVLSYLNGTLDYYTDQLKKDQKKEG